MELLQSIYSGLLGKEKRNKYRLAQIAEIAFANTQSHALSWTYLGPSNTSGVCGFKPHINISRDCLVLCTTKNLFDGQLPSQDACLLGDGFTRYDSAKCV